MFLFNFHFLDNFNPYLACRDIVAPFSSHMELFKIPQLQILRTLVFFIAFIYFCLKLYSMFLVHLKLNIVQTNCNLQLNKDEKKKK